LVLLEASLSVAVVAGEAGAVATGTTAAAEQVVIVEEVAAGLMMGPYNVLKKLEKVVAVREESTLPTKALVEAVAELEYTAKAQMALIQVAILSEA
jgi:hypothetical protein